ncbi:D-beta-hydroxybutyrate dehydrogenase, mitochondrial-like isoform X2 [Macrobrachium rosenbergii]|uniref:D-beta-hydroxybutyrate dehydrogenase, mitochondrial-like isoform X2 n=1 Tax=Macrobrachium rosenbergii TaxID=79674 RepID=UPI0034D7282B
MKLTVDRTRDVLLAGAGSALLAGLASCLGIVGFSTTFVVAWIASVSVSLFSSSLKISATGKSVLITGCDSGFGFQLALHLHRLGFDVFAGCLLANHGGEGAEQLRGVCSDRLHVIQLDVTNSKQLNEALRSVKDILALNGSRVVNVSSMLGRMVYPMGSPYIATKYAVEGYSNCLRLEMRRWGVHVCTIEPGNLLRATRISTKEHMKDQAEKMWSSMSEELREELGGRKVYDLQVCIAMGFSSSGMKDATIVVEAMTDALTQKYPRARYLPMEFYNWASQMIANYLPECFFDNICSQVMRFLAWWHRSGRRDEMVGERGRH